MNVLQGTCRATESFVYKCKQALIFPPLGVGSHSFHQSSRFIHELKTVTKKTLLLVIALAKEPRANSLNTYYWLS